MASAFAAAAVLAGSSISGIAAAAALACAFEPDFGADFRVALAGVLRVDREVVRLAAVLPPAAELERFAGALRVDLAEEPALAEEPELRLVAGFLPVELDRLEPDFARLLGFFGVAITTHYS